MNAGEPRGNGPILFYDGECGLCARSVRWCLDHDARGLLRFAPLQGETYRALDLPAKPKDLETVVLLDDLGLHSQGDAVLRVARHVGGGWRALAALARVVPRPWRDAAYRCVTRHRRAGPGAGRACRLPAPADRARFLP